MKTYYSLLAISLISISVKSQNVPNPYASIGKPAPRMVTLSGGAYDEFLLKKPLVLINSDAIDRKTGEMVYSKEENPEMIAKLEQEEKDKFRFLSIDPLAKQFPFYTPYQFAANSPIAAIDMDGMESFVANKNYQSNAIILSLLNAEDALSVAWSDQDKSTSTDPLMISEVAKFVYNVKVDKNTGVITIPESKSTPEQNIKYTKYQQEADGAFKKDANGNYIPAPGQPTHKKDAAIHIPGNFGIVKAGGYELNENVDSPMTPDQILSLMNRGAEPETYDRIDVYVKNPALKEQVFNKLKSWGDMDMNKVNFVESPNNPSDNLILEIKYKDVDKNVSEIE